MCIGTYLKSALKMIESLLKINENKRMNVSKVLHCDWFKHYWAQYKTHIQKNQNHKEKDMLDKLRK